MKVGDFVKCTRPNTFGIIISIERPVTLRYYNVLVVGQDRSYIFSEDQLEKL